MQCLNQVQALLRPLEQLSGHQDKRLDYDFTLIGISQRSPWRGSDVPISSTGACMVSPKPPCAPLSIPSGSLGRVIQCLHLFPSLIPTLKVKSELDMRQRFILTLMFPVVSTQALKRALSFATELCLSLPKPVLQIYLAPVVLLK